MVDLTLLKCVVCAGDKPWMSFGEYMDLINASGLITESFSKNSTRPCFVYSLMIEENELTTSRYKEMTPVEFYEAVRSLALLCARTYVPLTVLCSCLCR